MKYFLRKNGGFTLVELVLVIVIIGVIAGVATIKMMPSLETARIEATKSEMQALAYAIVGNPETYTDGARSDFGYVGDNGGLPPDLDALAVNPGLATWDGPYIKSDVNVDDFRKDAWNVDYVYNDTLLRSTGSGDNIDKLYASGSAGLLSNSVSGYLLDADSEMPGAVYRDSIFLWLTYPNGSGAFATASTNPGANGDFSFTGVPVGNHTLRVIYLPDTDTASFSVCVMPSRECKVEVHFPADLW